MKLRSPTPRPAELAEVWPAAAPERDYAKALRIAVRAMDTSTRGELARLYAKALRSNRKAGTIRDEDIAADASPFGDQRAMFDELTKLRDKWTRYFKRRAKDMAADFVQAAYAANKAAWQQRANKAGFDVPMQLSAAQRTVLAVKVTDNVSLIRSIPEQYFQRIEGDVARGFLAGRDLEAIASELRATGETTQKRAALIARDQANKLTAQLNGARQGELGIRYAYWKHSTAGKEPRVNHLRASREGWIFDTQVGINFGDQFGITLPGEPINCRCGSRSIIPGLDEEIRPEDLEPVAGFPGAFRKKKR